MIKDCTNIYTFVEEWQRRQSHPETTDAYSTCDLYSRMFDIHIGNKSLTDELRILQDWSDSHPSVTRAQKFMNLLKGTEFEELFTIDDSHGSVHGLVKLAYTGTGVWRTENSYDADGDVAWWNEEVTESEQPLTTSTTRMSLLLDLLPTTDRELIFLS